MIFISTKITKNTLLKTTFFSFFKIPGAFLAILLVSTAALCQAEEVAKDTNERLATTTNGNVILGTELLVYGGIIVMIVLGLIGVIGLFIPKEEEFATGYYAPS